MNDDKPIKTDINKMKTNIVMAQNIGTFSDYPYTPQQIKKAYCFNSCNTGKGEVIAIIDAFGNPNIQSDLEVFNSRFNLPPADLTVLYPQGQPTNIDPGWALETALDVEWAHAMAPSAKILLVIAIDDSTDNLFAAVDYAVQQGANIVSMSFGSEEFPEELSYDYHFNVAGVVFVAASGDAEKVVYPAASPYVIAAGGTSLQLDATGNRVVAEIAWSRGGGGISKYEPKAPWQYIKTEETPTNNRTIPDVSFFADQFPGVFVYTSIPVSGYVGWLAVGGTSISAPCISSIIANAIAPFGRAYNFGALLYKLAGGTVYKNPFNAYYDVINGNNGYYAAVKGYDYVTGLGTINEGNFIKAVRELQTGCHPRY